MAPMALLALLLPMGLINLVQAQAGIEEHIEVAEKQVTLQDVCANRQVPIISVGRARDLIRELKANPGACPHNYVQSFYELEPILVLEQHE